MEVEGQVGRRNFTSPPLHLWHPALSGDIPIRITADGPDEADALDALCRLVESGFGEEA